MFRLPISCVRMTGPLAPNGRGVRVSNGSGRSPSRFGGAHCPHVSRPAELARVLAALAP